jgi:hypothetical protein
MPDPPDGARTFAGNTPSYALVAPSTFLAPTAELSVETWMRVTGVPGNGWSTLVAKHSTADRGPYGGSATLAWGELIPYGRHDVFVPTLILVQPHP